MNSRNRTSAALTLAVVPIAVVMSLYCPDGSAAPIILNPSFETDTFTNGPGGTVAQNFAISSWLDNSAIDVGINPFWTSRPTNPAGSPHADNGAIPDGDQVAFLRDTATLSQSIDGFEVGKTYKISYFENNRSGTHAPGGLKVSIDGTVIVADHATAAVGGANSYRFVTSDPFTATNTTHALTFGSTSGADKSVLIDNITIAEPGLVANWKFDETSGQVAVDSAGLSNGQLGNTAGVDTRDPTIDQLGKFGRAYSFDSSQNDLVALGANVGNFSGFDIGSITGWFNTNSTPRGALLSYRENSTNDRLILEMDVDGKLRFIVREANSNQTELKTIATFDDGEWHHMAVTQDGAATTLFVDGTEITAFDTSTNSGAWFDDITSANGMSIGWEGRANAANVPFDGLLDDFAVFDVVLTTEQLSNVINFGAENFNAENVNIIPEPSTLALTTFGLLGLLAWRRRRRG
ncbi:MAG: LamG domain-containing protein [Planctomycetes bacterium]|nr:LamG domain-containing protein [Planctomycetota bacterium]